MTTLNLIWWTMAPFALATWTAMIYSALFVLVVELIRRGSEDD